MQINNFETYGKAPLWKKEVVRIVERFKGNKYSITYFNSKGIQTYIPKLNRTRLYLGLIVAVISAAVPMTAAPITVPLAIRWAIK